jgi:8-hydroxy-5-deazaflavin:NADPH oxidoreductase
LRVGVPLAADDREAMEIVAGLVRDAGFDPVLVGPLSRAREFDVGAPVYNTNMSGPEVRQALQLPQTGTASR